MPWVGRPGLPGWELLWLLILRADFQAGADACSWNALSFCSHPLELGGSSAGNPRTHLVARYVLASDLDSTMGRDFCLNTGLRHWSHQEAKNDATKKGVDRGGKSESREAKGSPRCRREIKWQFKWEWKAGISGNGSPWKTSPRMAAGGKWCF